MFEDIRPGLTHSKTIEVTPELTVAAISKSLPAVYGTPAMILLMETAAAEAMEPHLPEGHISVGTEVNIRHLAATPLNEKVTATVRVLEAQHNLVKFEIEVHDEHQLIGSGTHTRAVIELARFLRGMEKRRSGK